MYHHPDHLFQIVAEHGRNLRAEAAAHRLVEPVPARRRIAQSLRRAADRLDAVTAVTVSAGDVLPGRG